MTEGERRPASAGPGDTDGPGDLEHHVSFPPRPNWGIPYPPIREDGTTQVTGAPSHLPGGALASARHPVDLSGGLP
ncbi:MAG: hypothetical protein ACLPWO_03800 [Thermoplasmata archaeon]